MPRTPSPTLIVALALLAPLTACSGGSAELVTPATAPGGTSGSTTGTATAGGTEANSSGPLTTPSAGSPGAVTPTAGGRTAQSEPSPSASRPRAGSTSVPAPAALGARSLGPDVQLFWTPAEPAPAYYLCLRRSGTTTWHTVARAVSAANSCVDHAPGKGTYLYGVTAVSGSGTRSAVTQSVPVSVD